MNPSVEIREILAGKVIVITPAYLFARPLKKWDLINWMMKMSVFFIFFYKFFSR